MYFIRHAVATESKEIQNVTRPFRKELPFVSLSQIEQSISSKELFVAEEDGRIVGFVRFHIRRDRVTTLYDLAVHPDFQNKGVGSALVFAVPTPIQLRCTISNPANRFYRKLGFRLLSVEQGKHQKLNLYRLDHLLVYIRGGDALAPESARIAGIPYGIRSDYYAYDRPLFIDIHWKDYDWNDYLEIVSKYRPIQALAPDYEHSSQKQQLLRQIEDLRALGVLRIGVCPKFDDGINDIPSDCILQISVPSKYAGFLPNQSLQGKKLHLLGGHPDQWMYLIRYRYPKAHFLSMDGNIMGYKAALGQFWNKGWKVIPDGKFNKTRLAAVSFRNTRRELLNCDLPRLTSSKRVLRCAVNFTPVVIPKQLALFT